MRLAIFIFFALFLLHNQNIDAAPPPTIDEVVLGLTAPKGWECIRDPEQLPQKVLCIYVGKGKTQFTPSINVSSEKTNLSLMQYTQFAKQHHEKEGGAKCQLLGKFRTKSGEAELLQIDRVTQWGEVRFIQAFLIHEEEAYVITATCLQDEFNLLSVQFFKAIQSFSLGSKT